MPLVRGKQIVPGNTPTNYTPTSGNLNGALDGINTALGAGGNRIYMWAVCSAQAAGTEGLMQWVTANSSSPGPGGMLPQTGPSVPGINNGSICPIVMPACTLVRARLVKAASAVSGPSVGPNVTARFDLYSAGFSSRTLITSLDFPVSNVNTNNNLGADNFEASTLTPSVAIAANSLLGLQFTPRSATSSQINAIARAHVLLEFST